MEGEDGESKIQDENIRVKKWHAIASWKFNNSSDVCSICRCNFQEVCNGCASSASGVAPSNCPIVSGGCNHQFHSHCL
jgi:hypothetical protein